MPEGVIKYLTSEDIMRGLPLQKLDNHVPLQRSVFRVLGHPVLKQLNSASHHTKDQVLQTADFGILLRINWFKIIILITERCQQQAYYLICCHHVIMCTSDAPSSMTSAHPIPANSQSHSQRGFCVLLKSLKHLFPVYADTCKGTPKGTGLQSYRVPQTAFSIQVVETSHSPWTTCLLGQALPHSVFAASCSKLPAHKQCF